MIRIGLYFDMGDHQLMLTPSNLPHEQADQELLRQQSRDVQELAMPGLERGHSHKRARTEDSAAAPLAAAGSATPDRGLLAPDKKCPICLNAPEWPTITPCSHVFCRWATTKGQAVHPLS